MLDPFVLLAPVLVLPIVGLLRFIGCTSFAGEDAPSSTGPASSPVTVTVTPTPVSVCPNKSASFTATVANSSNTDVTWSLTGGGSIAPVGNKVVYTAPSTYTPGTATITATSKGDNTKSATATVNLIPNSATPVNLTPPNRPDLTTKGNWHGTYGSKGWVLAGDTTLPDNVDLVHLPTYLPVFDKPPDFVVEGDPNTDVRAPQKPHLSPPPGDFSKHFAIAWREGPPSASITVVFDCNDSDPHKVSVYFVDWERFGRIQHVDMKDGVNVLDSTDMDNFGESNWLQWTIQGKITMVVTLTTGPNLLMHGIFFD